MPARRPEAPGEVASCRQQLALERARLRAEYDEKPDAGRYLRGHRIAVDAALRELWRAVALPRALALVAVGGYGRGELYPRSDVDILVLLPGPIAAADEQAIERFVGHLWDVGIELGHSVRTVDQCVEEAAKDITVQTALLEARFLGGSRAAFDAFRTVLRSGFEPEAFFKAKRLEQEQRHEKYQDSPYSLEPNLKEAPGGLRDLHVILWVSRASGLGADWRDLAARGLVTRQEALELRRHAALLAQIRIRLHLLAGRREDRILFDYQSALAESFRIAATGAKRPSELFMQRYYRAAKAVTQLNTILLQNLGAAIFPASAAAPAPLNARFQMVRELLDARDPLVFEREPDAILESFLLLQQHSELKGMTAPTLRALWRARTRIDGRFRRDPENRARFLALLQQPRGIVHELRRMNQYSILGRYLPPWGRIVGQMQHDLFHVYTVDQHILQVIRNVRRFTMVEFAHEYPLCSRLIANFERHWLLYVAAMFHDIAKGRGGDHSHLGMLDARRFCRAHGVARDDTRLVEFLVEHHLTMSAVAQKKDLSDPDVIRDFAAVMQSERRLVALYLLTVADIRGTSPKVWNAWKGKLLEDLFRLTRRVLRGDGVSYDVDVQTKQAEALRLLRLYALSDQVGERLWRELDVAYFLRHDPNEIAWQTRNLHFRVDADQPVVKARLSPIGEGLQVMIYARDQPELFARICGYFESIGYSIADAKIHTTRHGYALDTFLVLGSGTSPHYREMISLIEHDLAERLVRQAPLGPSPRGRVSRQLKHFPITPEVHVRPDEKGIYHSLSITAGDRPGLLYAIALLFSKYRLDLHTAKIVTLGERAEDVFLVSGEALGNSRVMLQLEQELLEALQ
ncbi:MAG TPA: [protein-PII] uridylyltransferase [Burkholderiales bacterium]|nr:[protein-PII] uridylyltransferase [Burkholderiales bacterium]